MFGVIAQTTQPATQIATTQQAAATDPPPGWVEMFFKSPVPLFALVLVIFYVMMIRSKRGTERKRQDMLGQLKKGDKIQTIGGILGTVIEARDTEVLVKVDETNNTKVRFARSAIHRVVDPEPKPQAAK